MIGALYSTAMRIRNACFDAGILKSSALPIPTVSVGNITVGGTGKTPIVIAIADALLASGEKPCILTRGYGRKEVSKRVLVSDGKNILADASEGGDEPFEMAKKLEGRAVIIADRDRLSAGRWAAENLGATIAILDDGFQHRKVKRDLDVVCIDATNPFGNGLTLPFGKLRESLVSLRRANILMITRANLISDDQHEKIISRLKTFSQNSEVFLCMNETERISSIEKFFDTDISSQSFEEVSGGKCFLFCGIGNPENLLRQIESDGIIVGGRKFLRDHSNYTQEQIRSIEERARGAGASCLLTTAKDAVKLGGIHFTLPCFVIETRQVFDDEPRFLEVIDSIRRK